MNSMMASNARFILCMRYSLLIGHAIVSLAMVLMIEFFRDRSKNRYAMVMDYASSLLAVEA